MIVFWFSRRREFYADEAGARLGSRQGMINALERLKRDAQQPSPLPESMQAFGITGGKNQVQKTVYDPPAARRADCCIAEYDGLKSSSES
jgi:heat shock protein HtpX